MFAVGLVVYGWRVGAPSPWRDEGATIEICRRPLGEILAVTRTIDLVHLAYYLIARLVLTLHDSVTTLRLVSVVAMAAAAALLVRVGARLGDPLTGGLAGLLLVASPLASRWAQDARPFALVTLAAVASTLVLVSCPDVAADAGPPRARWRWWGYGLSLLVLGVLNVLALLLVVAHGLFVVLTRPRPVRRRWAVATAGGLAAVGPFVALTFGQRAQVDWITTPAPSDLVVPFAAGFGSRYVLLAVAGLTALAGALVLRARHRRAPFVVPLGVLAPAWAVAPPVVLWGVSQVDPLWDAHYVLFALPGLALGTALVLRLLAGAGRAVVRGRHTQGSARAGLTGSRLRQGLVVGGLTGVLCLAGIPAQASYRDVAAGHGEDLRGVAAFLGRQAQPGDAVLYAPYKLRVIGNVYPDLTRGLADVALARTPSESATIHGVDVTAAELPARIRGHRRVWLVHGPYRIREEVDRVKVDLPRLGYRSAGDTEFTGFVVTRYDAVPEQPAG